MEFFETLQDTVRRLVWTDLVELMVIGLVVFGVMRFLRGTRGARLLRGFLLLLVGGTVLLSLLANVFDLARIKTIIPFFVGGLFLAALVAFQPELRRALIRLGAATFFGDSSRDIDLVIREVAEACAVLSKRRIGAIIAILRGTELGALTAAGCRLDAEVSKELLITLFWPGSPLHDMGVVIGQGRIISAAVQFPLTDSEDLDPSMGSRHRAAIGLSTETDALVVIVSEETGIISLAERGEVRRFLTVETLTDLLRERIGAPPPKAAPDKEPVLDLETEKLEASE